MTNPTTGDSSLGRVRASDAEREEYATIIRTGMTEGRLNLEDGEERLGKVYAATYRDELDPTIADLPRSSVFNTPEFVDQAKRRLRSHTGGVVFVAMVLTGVWLLVAIVAHPVFFWPIIPIGLMTIGLMKHRRRLRWAQRGWSPWAGGQWQGGPPWANRGWDREGWGGPGAQGGPGYGAPGGHGGYGPGHGPRGHHGRRGGWGGEQVKPWNAPGPDSRAA